MKKNVSLVVCTLLLVLLSCSRKPDDAGVVYEYVERDAELSEFLQDKIGGWAEEGKSCYGILALVDGQGNMVDGAVIKAKIIRFKGDSVKMRSLVDLKLREVEGCDKMGISRGQTWWETEGDIFQTEEEAQQYLGDVLGKVLE